MLPCYNLEFFLENQKHLRSSTKSVPKCLWKKLLLEAACVSVSGPSSFPLSHHHRYSCSSLLAGASRILPPSTYLSAYSHSPHGNY